MSDYTVSWNLPELGPEKQDACFYRVPDASFILTVTRGDRSVDVYCDGDMRYRHADGWVVRYGDDWDEYGITDDAKLMALDNDGWDMNPWFDCYRTSDGEHFDAVQHTIGEAIEQAKAIIDEDEYWTVTA